MATPTPSYGFNLPTVGGDTNIWGGLLNSNWSLMDDLLDGTTPVDGIAITGGTVDNAVIGSVTPSTALFTTASATSFVASGFINTPQFNRAAGQRITMRFNAVDLFRFDEIGLRFGAAAAEVSLDLQDRTDALSLPLGTTAQRPAASAGRLRYNSDTNTFEGSDGTQWGTVGGGTGRFKGENGTQDPTGVGAGDIFRVNEKELNTDVTIEATENASCAGPLTVATGVTLTVSSGGELVIL